MAYKLKPNKSVLARFKFTKTGKVKRGHSKTSHLMSNRSGDLKRRLGRPAIMDETQGKRVRKLAGLSHMNPKRYKHTKAIAERSRLAAEAPAPAAA